MESVKPIDAKQAFALYNKYKRNEASILLRQFFKYVKLFSETGRHSIDVDTREYRLIEESIEVLGFEAVETNREDDTITVSWYGK